MADQLLIGMCGSVQERASEEPFKSMTDSQQQQALVKELHLLKTDLFMKMVEDGMMPLRPGVKRLVSVSHFWIHALLLRSWTIPSPERMEYSDNRAYSWNAA